MYLISYDITSDKIRNKIAKKLEDYGKRVQYSVFECNLTKSRFQKLYTELIAILDDDEEGNIRIYPMDTDVKDKVMIIGASDPEDSLGKEEVIFI